jgi:hypothetical protein
MKATKTMPIDVVNRRLAQLKKEKEELVIDLEMEKQSDVSSGRDVDPSDYDAAYGFFHTEIYKYDFCIDEFNIILNLLKAIK